jgi:hypothetical protein
MADATKVTVDGVEPSIPVRYIGNISLGDTNNRIDLFRSDNGISRSLYLNGDVVYITPNELSRVNKGFQIEIVKDQEAGKSVSSSESKPIPSVTVSTPSPIAPAQGS